MTGSRLHRHLSWTKRPLRQVLLSLTAMLVVYGNLVVMLNPYLRRGDMRLALPPALDDLFLIFGVFSYYETISQEMTIWGLARNAANGTTYWKQLPTPEYLPHRRGEQSSRLWADRHYRTLDREGHWSAWRFLGRKILERHNRLNPRDPISKVAIQSNTWPRSVDGFYAKRTPNSETRRYWIVAE